SLDREAVLAGERVRFELGTERRARRAIRLRRRAGQERNGLAAASARGEQSAPRLDVAPLELPVARERARRESLEHRPDDARPRRQRGVGSEAPEAAGAVVAD